MHKELKESDVQRMARGTWDDYFRSRLHPKVKTPWLIALITFLTGLAVVFAIVADTVRTASQVSVGMPAVSYVAVILVLVAVAFFLKGQFTLSADRDKFVERALALWEADGSLPDADAVHAFLYHRHESKR